VAKPPGSGTLNHHLNRLAKRHNICDQSGQIWHFSSHQFRHTVGTTMANRKVPIHIIARYLGHDSLRMTQTYAHIHDQTLKEEVAKLQGKVVTISGAVVEATTEVDTGDLQWFKRHVQAQALPNGSCALPAVQKECPHANACLTCTHFRTTAEFLDQHKAQLSQTETLIEKAEANGWQRQVEMNRRIAQNLKQMIGTLEAPDASA
jgi:integrase/recombinase XerD